MKFKFLIAIILFCNSSAFAQFTVNFIMSSRPPARVSEWVVKKEVITLIVLNQTGERRNAKIKCTVKAPDGAPVSATDLNIAPVAVIGGGNTVFNANTVYPLEVQVFADKYKNILNRTGKLRSGNGYQITVQIVDAITFAPLSQEVTRLFFIAGLQLPILMKPYNEELLDINKAATAITFRWTPLMPFPQGTVNYRLQVFEIYDGQQPVQALRSNQPVLDQIVSNRTQYIWQPRLGFLKETDSLSNSAAQATRFIWTIQTIDGATHEVFAEGSNEGRSEPFQFKLVTVSNSQKKNTVQPEAKGQ